MIPYDICFAMNMYFKWSYSAFSSKSDRFSKILGPKETFVVLPEGLDKTVGSDSPVNLVVPIKKTFSNDGLNSQLQIKKMLRYLF